jgi:enoyl-CoA hydratase/carnithine racemase
MSARRRSKGSSQADSERVQIARRGEVVVWTIHRPEVRNAIDFATFGALLEAIDAAQRDRRVRAIVLTGSGTTFVSGGDLRELRSHATRAGARRILEQGRRVCDGIARIRVPVIAALPGPAVGGGAELATACDMRVAEARASLSFKHARMGVTTAWGILPRLVAMTGSGAAARLLLAGQGVTAREALQIGLVDVVCEDGACLATALAWARDVAKGSPGAVAALKTLLRGAGGTPRSRLRAQERTAFADAWTGRDHGEAVEAFFEGRAPKWGAR